MNFDGGGGDSRITTTLEEVFGLEVFGPAAGEGEVVDKAENDFDSYHSSGNVAAAAAARGGGRDLLGRSLSPTTTTATEEEKDTPLPFTDEELRITVKVMELLRNQPSLFLTSEKLRATGLQWLINRGRVFNRDHGGVYERLEKLAVKQRKKSMKQADEAKISKTEMRIQREQALRKLMMGNESTAAVKNAITYCSNTLSSPSLPPPLDDNNKDNVVCDTAAPPVGLPSQTTTTATTMEGNEGSAESAVELSTTATTTTTTTSEQQELNGFLKCYICKYAFNELHFFYYVLCPKCATLNWSKRNQKIDLTGKVVLLTGSRIKIGQQICLSLLRNGATVIATTRYAADMLQRYSEIEDYADWKDRLHIYRLDLRNLWLVQRFCKFVRQKYSALYAIINNAAQTVARTPAYYKNLIEKEMKLIQLNQAQAICCSDQLWNQYVVSEVGIDCAVDSAATLFAGNSKKVSATSASSEVVNSEGTATSTSTVVVGDQSQNNSGGSNHQRKEWFDMYDTCQTALDQRNSNSWTQTLDEVSGEEAAEVHAINALAPFIINSQLKSVLMKCFPDESEESRQRFIINVSAMEGQFYRFKSDKHPHTNMAKASMNMMTRTSAQGYAEDKIYMNSVDTGWITDENPYLKQLDRYQRGHLCPLDEVDAAARVLDLIYIQSVEHGKFWKDYREIPW